MSISYPVSVDTLTNPNSTSKQNNPDHAIQHANANDAIEAIETKLGTSSSTASSGTVLRGTGSGASAFGAIVNADIDASAAIAFSKLAASAWTAFTPTASVFTIGNGTTSGKYIKIGRIITYVGAFTVGSTTSGGVFTFNLPFVATDTTEKGTAQLLDASPGTFWDAICHKGSTSTIVFYANNSAQALAFNYAVPFTWATSDSIAWTMTYESTS